MIRNSLTYSRKKTTNTKPPNRSKCLCDCAASRLVTNVEIPNRPRSRMLWSTSSSQQPKANQTTQYSEEEPEQVHNEELALLWHGWNSSRCQLSIEPTNKAINNLLTGESRADAVCGGSPFTLDFTYCTNPPVIPPNPSRALLTGYSRWTSIFIFAMLIYIYLVRWSLSRSKSSDPPIHCSRRVSLSLLAALMTILPLASCWVMTPVWCFDHGCMVTCCAPQKTIVTQFCGFHLSSSSSVLLRSNWACSHASSLRN
jgi:hypothetical protein